MDLHIDFARNSFSVDISANEFSNCHFFSLTTIQALLKEYPDNVSSSISQETKKLLKVDPNNPKDIEKLYIEIYKSGKMTSLFQNNCALAPAISLILFLDISPEKELFLQHSMLIRDADEWIGANNINSLGVPDQAYPLSGPGASPTDVWGYPNMSQRTHFYGKRGGWKNNDMVSIIDKDNLGRKLFYIPVVV